MQKKKTVDIIIPTYNEAETIGKIVEVAKSSPYANRVIVVSDGSTDQTASIAKKAGANIIQHRKNKGKGEAILSGLKKSSTPIILFLDADLLGFTKKHIEQLVKSVLDGKSDMNIGLRDNKKTNLQKHLPLISGERALKREIIESIPKEHLYGFMLETVLNHYCKSHKLRVTSIKLEGLTIRRKIEKRGIIAGVKNYLKMLKEMIIAFIIVRSKKSR